MINDILRHDDNFTKDGLRLLQECTPKYDLVYHLTVTDKQYQSFLQFLIEELDSLPYDNTVGKTILMRADAKKVVTDLSENLKSQLERISCGREWNNKIKSIENYFCDQLEVFKNEIYPGMNRCGIGYNLDLGNLYLLPITELFVLERYFVDARGENHSRFTIRRNGRIELRFFDGKMSVDLSEDEPGGIHLG